MSTPAARLFAEGFVTGFFDMITTMIGEQVSTELTEVDELTAEAVSESAEAYGAVMQAVVEGGGAVAVLLPAAETYGIYAQFMETEAPEKDPVDEEDLDALKEVYEPCLGAAVSFFKEKYEQVITLSDSQVVPGGSGAGQTLSEFIGDAGTVGRFSFSSPSGMQGEGAILFASDLEAYVPAGEPEEAGGLEQAAVDDILEGVGMPAAASPSPAAPAESAPNLDMVLDIDLEVKARLGRVEMPIEDILALGPGSIIEVGHLVDDPVELLVNNRLIARGDVVVVDEKFGLRITEIATPKERIESLR